ncbi:endolytic transglycosylase MltG [Streptomyces sp. NPDC091272]|uniref:endolytic transglycosylase MltG n=1 Tax=Streptomyces sp. NPDC091272 TaxID=3365981 RepID=UPI003818F97F
MTEYGRGQGSEPWHPEDPLYGDQGDQGWGGQQAGHGQVPYDAAHGQDQQQVQVPYGPPGHDGPPQQQYAQQGGAPQQPYYDSGQYPQQHQGGHYLQQHDGGQYPQGRPHGQYQQGHDSGQYPQAVPSGPQQYAGQENHGGWDTGQQHQAVPYGMNAADPYSGQQPGYGGEQQDYYGTPEAYPPPQPPAQRSTPPEPVIDWDPEAPAEEEHPFFTGTDNGRTPPRGGEDDDEYDDDPRSARRGKGGKPGKGKKKSRNGCACLVVSAVLLGGLGGVAYVGYDFWQARFGAAEDYSGEGTDPVQIEVKKGADGNEIANTLKKMGVVKSVSAFTAEMGKDPKKGNSIQVGVYTMKKEMSAKAALELMLNPASRNNYNLPPGTRNLTVYAELDKRLELKPGTTKAVAKAQAKNLGLPAWVPNDPELKDPLEGFLYPATYPVAKGTKPEEVLKKMVAEANQHYAQQDLAGEAQKLGLKSPFELLTVASLVQKEGKYAHDFGKVARVVYNRIKPDNQETVGRLEFDSTVNYFKATSTLDIGSVDEARKFNDPYNTYGLNHKGLTPGPISNPGDEALTAAINPTPGPWYYFVSVTSEKTLFAATNAEHEKNRREYQREREKEKSGQ